jgi:hypothetical protein
VLDPARPIPSASSWYRRRVRTDLDRGLLLLALVGFAGGSLACERGTSPASAPRPDDPAMPTDPNTPAEPAPVEPSPSPTVEAPAEAVTCLARYAFDSDSSVLAEQRRRGGAARWNDFATRYPAAYLDPDVDHPVERLARFEIGATPLLWFTADFSEAVVNAAVLGELKVVDATGLGVGESIEIGALTELGRGHLHGRAWQREPNPAGFGGRELSEFLLAAGVVQTFVHIGAQLCLLAEVDDEAGYRARFTGEHEYYTQAANFDPLGFELTIAATGRITIVGVEPVAMPPVSPTP